MSLPLPSPVDFSRTVRVRQGRVTIPSPSKGKGVNLIPAPRGRMIESEMRDSSHAHATHRGRYTLLDLCTFVTLISGFQGLLVWLDGRLSDEPKDLIFHAVQFIGLDGLGL